MHAAIYFFGGAMMASLRAACFKRRACVRCPFGGRLESFLIILSAMGVISFSIFERGWPCLDRGNGLSEIRTDPLIGSSQSMSGWCLKFLALAVGDTPHPIFKSPASRFLISELRSDLPVRDPFTTFTGQGLFCRSFTFCRFIDDCFVR